MWYVIGLVWIAAMAGIIMSYTRKQRRRVAQRAGDMAALLADIKANPVAAMEKAGIKPAPAAPVAGPEFRRKQRLLPSSTALLYYVFRTGLPDHEIFAGLVLGDVLDIATAPPGVQREQLQRRIATQRLELVVCNKQLEVIAAVLTRNAVDGPDAENTDFANRYLESAGIRVVSLDPAAPPRHHQVRALIYG